MRSEWQEASLSSLCIFISRGITPSYDENGVCVINQKCIRDNFVSFEQARSTNPTIKKIPNKKYLQPYDILINSTGTGTLGRVAQVHDVDRPITVDSHVTIVRAANEIDKKFLGYALVNQQRKIESLAHGSTGQTELSRERLGNEIIIRLPKDKSHQHSIAATLACLDDKIELNNKINANLEAQAQAIFKSWFVDFEPFRDGEFVDSELGPIPKGWRVGTVADYVVDMKNGGTPSRKNKEYWNSRDIPWIKTGEILNRPIMACEEYISQKGYKNSSVKMLPVNSVLIALYGATAAKLALLRFKATTNQACCAMICSSANSAIYLYLKLLNKQEYIKSLSIGSAQQNLSKDIIASLPLLIPPLEIMEHLPYDLIYDVIEKNIRQSRILAILRDTLLPRLMSGEIEVPAAEEMIQKRS